jgi:hypothetical protein
MEGRRWAAGPHGRRGAVGIGISIDFKPDLDPLAICFAQSHPAVPGLWAWRCGSVMARRGGVVRTAAVGVRRAEAAHSRPDEAALLPACGRCLISRFQRDNPRRIQRIGAVTRQEVDASSSATCCSARARACWAPRKESTCVSQTRRARPLPRRHCRPARSMEQSPQPNASPVGSPSTVGAGWQSGRDCAITHRTTKNGARRPRSLTRSIGSA